MAHIRFMRRDEPALFAAWEKAERPYPWTEKHFQETLNTVTGATLVSEESGRPCGYVVVQCVKDEGYVMNMMVEPTQRRRGWGRRLLEAAAEELKRRGATVAILDVDAMNYPAQQLYRKQGYADVAQRKRSYPRGEDAVTMRKYL